ncbi:Alpha/Beta hydrolase protein [Mycena filopes]|nr:Alpha/Beta hydrolase protein [Mycena filopes]
MESSPAQMHTVLFPPVSASLPVVHSFDTPFPRESLQSLLRPWSHSQDSPEARSYEPYIRAILSPASKKVKDGGLGYRVVVVNGRGSAGVPVSSPRLYTAGHTDDFRQALVYLSHMYPRAPLLGVGFSMGAGILIKYLAEEGSASRLVSGCALACTWDNVLNSNLLESTFFTRNVWARGMGTNWYNLLKGSEKSLRAFPNHPFVRALPLGLARRHPRLSQFDQEFTRRVGGPEPVFPFPDVNAFHRWTSSDAVLKDVKTPLLAINSTDDPLVRAMPSDGGGNPYVVIGRSRIGGHLGWFKAGGGRWVTQPVLEWLRMTAEEVEHEWGNRPHICVDGDGFLRAEGGDESLGCREFGDSGVVDGNRGRKGMLQGL